MASLSEVSTTMAEMLFLASFWSNVLILASFYSNVLILASFCSNVLTLAFFCSNVLTLASFCSIARGLKKYLRQTLLKNLIFIPSHSIMIAETAQWQRNIQAFFEVVEKDRDTYIAPRYDE